jgi:hypothetical protein
MNAPWEEQQTVAIFNKVVDFPALTPVSKNVANIPSKVKKSSAKSPANETSVEISAAKSRASMHKPHKSVTHVPAELNSSKSRTHVPVNTATAPFAAGPPFSLENKGRVMLEKMGWSQGTALGAIDNKIKLESVLHASAATVPAPAVPAWGTISSTAPASATLFPNAPPAVTPPAALMESLSISTLAEPIYGEHDPRNPKFDPKRYWNEISEAYKCPDPGCKRNLKSVTAFMQHIKSGKHQGLEKVTCPKCHRLFVNSTALTQHFESQAIRCDARKLGNADTWVQDFTQVAEIGGKNEDDTNKYVNRSDRSINRGDTVASVIEASRRAVEVRANMQENYWKKNKYESW